MIIRKKQIRTFHKAAAAQFERTLVEHIQRHFPAQASFIGEAAITETVRLGIPKAEKLGYRTQREIALFVNLMFLLGTEFDSDIQLEAIAAALKGPVEAESLVRINTSYDLAMAYLDEIEGPDGGNVARLLVRVRDLKYKDFESFSSGDLGAALHKFFLILYPAKAQKQGEAMTVQLAAAAVGAGPAPHVAIVATHAFLLGTGFLRDPQFPWIRPALEAGGPEALLPKSQEYAKHLLRMS